MVAETLPLSGELFHFLYQRLAVFCHFGHPVLDEEVVRATSSHWLLQAGQQGFQFLKDWISYGFGDF